MDDLISRQAAIDAIDKAFAGVFAWAGTKPYGELVLRDVPTAQPTLYGYNIEHLALVARVLQKENLPPERVTEALMDIGSIVAIVRGEFEEALKRSVEQGGTGWLN